MAFKHSEKLRLQRRACYKVWRTTPRGRAYVLLNKAKVRAKQSGVPVTVTPEWVADKLEAGICELTGIRFDFERLPQSGLRNPFSPSLDQRVPGKGYTPDNCRVICTAANLALNQFGELVFEHVAHAYLKKIAA